MNNKKVIGYSIKPTSGVPLRKANVTIELKRPLIIMKDDKEIFQGIPTDLKKHFKREEWEAVLDLYFKSKDTYLDSQVLRLYSKKESIVNEKRI